MICSVKCCEKLMGFCEDGVDGDLILMEDSSPIPKKTEIQTTIQKLVVNARCNDLDKATILLHRFAGDSRITSF
jgi:hypothetical protein